MELRSIMCALLVIISIQATKSNLEMLYQVTIPKSTDESQEGKRVCNNAHEEGMLIKYFYFKGQQEVECYQNNSVGREFGAIESGDVFLRMINICSEKTYCDFSNLLMSDPLRGCTLHIKYICMKKDYIIEVDIPEQLEANQRSGSACNNIDEDGMDVQHASITTREENCSERTEYEKEINDEYRSDLFLKILRSCNAQKFCDFSTLGEIDSLRGCTLRIYYKCTDKEIGEENITLPPSTLAPRVSSSKTRNPKETKQPVAKNVSSFPPTLAPLKGKTTRPPGADGEVGEINTKNGESTKDSKEKSKEDTDEDSEMMRMIFLIAIGVSVVAFLAVIIIVVLCGLFVCGWSSRFDRWNSTRRRRARPQQQQQQTYSTSSPLEEYAYIDQNTLLSNSKVSATTPSPNQPSEGKLKWKTSDASNSCNTTAVPFAPSPAKLSLGDSDDYAEIEDNNKSFVSPKATGRKKSSLGVSIPEHSDSVSIPPSQAGAQSDATDSYANHLGLTSSAKIKPPVLPSSPFSEPVQYTLPLPLSERPTMAVRPDAFQTTPNKANSGKGQQFPGHMPLARNLSHPGKFVAPSAPITRSPASSRHIPYRSEATIENNMSHSRRASLPRHSKLMENNSEIDEWMASGQADMTNHFNSQPSLAKHGTGHHSQQLYSHLGSQQAVTVLGNVYDG